MRVIAAILLGLIFIKQVGYIRKRRIAARASLTDKIVIGCGVALIGIVFLHFGRASDAAMMALAIAVLLTDCLKPGICDAGILLVARGKEEYLWAELGISELRQTKNTLEISWFSPTHARLAVQRYPLTARAEIEAVLTQNHVIYRQKTTVES